MDTVICIYRFTRLGVAGQGSRLGPHIGHATVLGGSIKAWLSSDRLPRLSLFGFLFL